MNNKLITSLVIASILPAIPCYFLITQTELEIKTAFRLFLTLSPITIILTYIQIITKTNQFQRLRKTNQNIIKTIYYSDNNPERLEIFYTLRENYKTNAPDLKKRLLKLEKLKLLEPEIEISPNNSKPILRYKLTKKLTKYLDNNPP